MHGGSARRASRAATRNMSLRTSALDRGSRGRIVLVTSMDATRTFRERARRPPQPRSAASDLAIDRPPSTTTESHCASAGRRQCARRAREHGGRRRAPHGRQRSEDERLVPRRPREMPLRQCHLPARQGHLPRSAARSTRGRNPMSRAPWRTQPARRSIRRRSSPCSAPRGAGSHPPRLDSRRVRPGRIRLHAGDVRPRLGVKRRPARRPP